MKLNFICSHENSLTDCHLNCDFLRPQSPSQLDLPVALSVHQNELFDHKIFSHFRCSKKLLMINTRERLSNKFEDNFTIISEWKEFFGCLNFHVYFPQNCHFYLHNETWDKRMLLKEFLMVINGSRDSYWRDKDGQTLLEMFQLNFLIFSLNLQINTFCFHLCPWDNMNITIMCYVHTHNRHRPF